MRRSSVHRASGVPEGGALVKEGECVGLVGLEEQDVVGALFDEEGEAGEDVAAKEGRNG